MIRLHRFQSQRTTAASDSILLNQFKYPIESIYLGLRPAVNVDSTNVNQYRDWHNLTRLTDQVLDVTSTATGDVMIDDTVAFNAASPKHKTFSVQRSAERIVYPESAPTIDTLQLDAHGISIYAQFARQFYRDYQLFIYGGDKIMTNSDLGSMMMNFCLFPGTYQPSGHMNVSRAREFYVKFVSSYVSAQTPADLLALGIAIWIF